MCRTDEFKKKATNYCIRFWSLVMVRNQFSQRNWLNETEFNKSTNMQFCLDNCKDGKTQNFSTALNHISNSLDLQPRFDWKEEL